jgi:hypothetical protein
MAHFGRAVSNGRRNTSRTYGFEKPIARPCVRRFFPLATDQCLPPLVEVNVVRPRGSHPGMAGVGPPLRALHIELSSTAKGPAARRGMMAGTSEVPRPNVFCEKATRVPEGRSWKPLPVNASRRDQSWRVAVLGVYMFRVFGEYMLRAVVYVYGVRRPLVLGPLRLRVARGIPCSVPPAAPAGRWFPEASRGNRPQSGRCHRPGWTGRVRLEQ